MYKVVKVTDHQGNPTEGVGKEVVGMNVLNAVTSAQVFEARRLIIGNDQGGGRATLTSDIQGVHAKLPSAPTDKEEIEVHTANLVYYLETESVMP